MSAHLYQIYYKEEQRSKLFHFSEPYFNEGLTIYFENDCIAKIVKNSPADKIGVCSWKLAEKIRKKVGIRGTFNHTSLDLPYDVLSLTRNSNRHSMLGMANQWHKDFVPTIKLLWSKLGYQMPGDARQAIYNNAFMAKSEIYKQYVNEFLIPAMELTNKDEEMYSRMVQPSGYSTLNREADLKSVKAKLGMNDYPLSTFILERCPALWFTLHRINVTYL